MNVGISVKTNHKILLFGGLTALLCSLLLYGALVLSAVYKQYQNMEITVQTLVCESLAQKLSRTTRLGIPPERMYDLDSYLEKQSKDEKNKSILVLNEKNILLVSWNYTGTFVPNIPKNTNKEQNNVQSFIYEDTIWLIHDIRDREGNIAGYVLLGIDANQMAQKLKILAYDNIILFAFISLCGCLLLLLLWYGLAKSQNKYSSDKVVSRIFKVRRYSVLIVPLIFVQCVFTFSLYAPLRTTQEHTMQEMAVLVGTQISKDIERLIGFGNILPQINASTEKHLSTIEEKLTWVLGINITEKDYNLSVSQGKTLSSEDWNMLETTAISGKVTARNPVTNKDIVTVDVLVSREIVTKHLFEIFLDMLTVTIITIVFMIEIVTVLILKEEQLISHSTKPLFTVAKSIRPIIFICMFAVTLPISFIPLRMAEISPTDLFGLPASVVMGLPISFEVVMAGIAIALGGFLSHKRGWRPLLLWGTCLVSLGNIVSGFAETPLLFILGRTCAGAGYGFINLAAQIFVIAHASANSRTSSLAVMVAGLMAGLLCGSALGGLIVDRLGYEAVFYAAALYMLIIGISLSFILKKTTWTPLETTIQALNIKELFAFLTDFRMASLLFFNILPCAFISTCLFQFYIPIFLNANGTSPAGIGRVSMLFCLIIVYLSPVIGRSIDNAKNKLWWLGGAGLLGAASMAVLPLFNSIEAAIFSVILLGLCNSIAYCGQGAYALELPATARFGSTRTMTMYNLMERFGQMLAPIVLGFTIALWGADISLITIAISIVILSILFLLITFVSQYKNKGH